MELIWGQVSHLMHNWCLIQLLIKCNMPSDSAYDYHGALPQKAVLYFNLNDIFISAGYRRIDKILLIVKALLMMCPKCLDEGAVVCHIGVCQRELCRSIGKPSLM